MYANLRVTIQPGTRSEEVVHAYEVVIDGANDRVVVRVDENDGDGSYAIEGEDRELIGVPITISAEF